MVEINIYLNKIPLDCNKNICHALVTPHNEKKNQSVSYQCEQLGTDTILPHDPCLLCVGTSHSFNKYVKRAKANPKHDSVYLLCPLKQVGCCWRWWWTARIMIFLSRHHQKAVLNNCFFIQGNKSQPCKTAEPPFNKILSWRLPVTDLRQSRGLTPHLAVKTPLCLQWKVGFKVKYLLDRMCIK